MSCPHATLSLEELPMKKSLLVLATLALAAAASAEPIKFARYPHAANGKLVFSYHGDIWIANENGVEPVRLTAHVARDTFPRLLARRQVGRVHERPLGNDDVFVVPVSRR